METRKKMIKIINHIPRNKIKVEAEAGIEMREKMIIKNIKNFLKMNLQ